MRPAITTISGKSFDFINPTPEMVCIADIAHALAHGCRFNGHVTRFYSVAQHSVLVSHIVPDEYALAGLLHDAPEAYLGDVTSPLKSILPDYKEIEKRVERAVFACFNLPPVVPDIVKMADLVLLATEKRDLMHEDDTNWECIKDVIPMDSKIQALKPEKARELFITRYAELV